MSTEDTIPDGTTDSTEQKEYEPVDPPIGWDGKTLKEMKQESEEYLEETGNYYGLDELELKSESPFEYERLFSRLRGALVSARETALNISASPVVRQVGELCFQVYTPEGDSVALSTGIIAHVHTGSLALKWMIDQDYEHGRGINPGDIYCNNDNDIGNVHTTDVHTFVPVFDDGELIAWVDGVTHELDSGGMTRGGYQVASTSRYEDGMYVTCEKIGTDDELHQDWKERSKRATRTPRFWDLDEKCRLAGCHMVRDAIKDIVDDVGSNTFKQFMREAIEEGRETLLQRTQNRMFPGTYQDTSFYSVPFEDEAWKPNTQVDRLNHFPMEIEIDEAGQISLDMEGTSSPGPHPYNASEGAMEAGLWLALTQSLLHDGKVNDGSHFAMDANFPEGSVVNPGDSSLSYHNAWGTILAAHNGLWKNFSRSFFARGFREEVVAGYNNSGDALQGGGEFKANGQYFPVAPMEGTSNGYGAAATNDGQDHNYALWNPETDMNDVEETEFVAAGLPYLSRRIKENTAGHGKYRGGAGLEMLRTPMGAEVSVYKQIFCGNVFSSSGMSGGYPQAANYTVRAHDTDLLERIQNQEEYPIGDVPTGKMDENLEGDVVRKERGLYFPKTFEESDVIHYQEGGGPGFGDPRKRDIQKVKEDVEEGIFTPDIVEKVYGVVGDFDEKSRTFTIDEEATEQRREELLDERREESVPFDEFYEDERERVREGDLAQVVADMYADTFDQSDDWEQNYREFWDLSEEFEFEESEKRTYDI